MRGTVIYGPRDVRSETRDDPKIVEPTDAVIRIAATCVCGSDLWPYRGLNPIVEPTPIGHEYCGIVEEVGREVKSVRPGQFVIGSFFASDNTCPHCRHGYQTSCRQKELVGGAQAEFLRVPLADGTLVATHAERRDLFTKAGWLVVELTLTSRPPGLCRPPSPTSIPAGAVAQYG